MSAGLTTSDSMFSVRVTPWHGLGAVRDRPPASVAEAIEAAGLGWSVVKKPLASEAGALLRREGLYTSHLAEWRKQRKQGAFVALDRKRGRKRLGRRLPGLGQQKHLCASEQLW